MRKILLFAIAGYAIYYFGTQHQKLKDQNGTAQPAVQEPARTGSSGIIFGKTSDLSLEPCRNEVADLCPNEPGLSGKINCLSRSRSSLSTGCSAALFGS